MVLHLKDRFDNDVAAPWLYVDATGGSCTFDPPVDDAAMWDLDCTIEADADELDVSVGVERAALSVPGFDFTWERAGAIERSATLVLGDDEVVASGTGAVDATFKVVDGGRNRLDAPVTGLEPVLTVDGVVQAGGLTEAASGVYTAEVPVTKDLAERAVRVTAPGLDESATFTQVAGAPAVVAVSVERATTGAARAVASEAGAASAAVPTWQLTATVEDLYGHRLAGHTPTLVFEPAQDHDPLTDNGDGTYTTHVRATGSFTVTASVGSVKTTASASEDSSDDGDEGEEPSDEEDAPDDEEAPDEDELAATGPLGLDGAIGLAAAAVLLGLTLLAARRLEARVMR